MDEGQRGEWQKAKGKGISEKRKAEGGAIKICIVT
jgi:hypothetical protein